MNFSKNLAKNREYEKLYLGAKHKYCQITFIDC